MTFEVEVEVYSSDCFDCLMAFVVAELDLDNVHKAKQENADSHIVERNMDLPVET